MKIKARKILNSRGEDSVEISVNGFRASAPSGKSRGKKEAKPFLRSVKEEVNYVNKVLSDKLKNIEIKKFDDLIKIENLTKKVGANTRVALEFAIIKNKGGYKFLGGKKIPLPLGNVVGGGLHSKNKSTEFQEFLILPKVKRFRDAARINLDIYNKLKKKFKKYQINDEGALSVDISNEDALELLSEFKNIRIGIDVAANSFYKNGYYVYKNKKRTRQEQINYILKLIEKFNLYYVEDPLQENDGKGFRILKEKSNCLICGDDLISTNLKLLKKNLKNVNAVIVKPNQIGSLIEVKKVIDLAKKNKIVPIMSHRSGETLDNTISHLAVGFNTPIIKCGVTKKERLAKINELIKIEKKLLLL